MIRPRFYIQVRFNAERRWRNHQSDGNLLDAVAAAQALAATKSAVEWVRPFPRVRLVFCGRTLALWINGSQTR